MAAYMALAVHFAKRESSCVLFSFLFSLDFCLDYKWRLLSVSILFVANSGCILAKVRSTERWGEVIATLTARAVRPLAVAEGWTRFLVEPFDDTWQHFYLLCSAPLNVVRASYFCSCRKEQMLPILPASINAYHTHKASAQLIHNKFHTPRSSSAHRST